MQREDRNESVSDTAPTENNGRNGAKDVRDAIRGSLIGGAAGEPRDYVARAYQDWLRTQEEPFRRERNEQDNGMYQNGISWLLDVPELFAARAPGITCLNALEKARRSNEQIEDYIRNPRNNSKGCGGVMRVAPVGLHGGRPGSEETRLQRDMEAAQIAAITHGHSLGYMPAAMLCHIVSRTVFHDGDRPTLKTIVLEAKDAAQKLFAGDENLPYLCELTDRAVALSENADGDLDNIHLLGEGWVAEEALAIAIYCALRHQDDFSAALIASVNHKGDSDSTGAILGNILGAWVGYAGIDEKWKTDIEIADVILELADDLCDGFTVTERGDAGDPAWISKYVYGQAYRQKR